MTYTEKLERLRKLVSTDTRQRLNEQGYTSQAFDRYDDTLIKEGKKYDKIDRDHSGMLMIERDSGLVYGIKGYGKIHRGHAFGSLDTIDDWFWGNCYAQRKATT